MHQSTITSHALLIRALIFICMVAVLGQGCASRAPSLRVLDKRAGYGSEMDDEDLALYQQGRKAQDSIVKQGGGQVTTAYIYPHELPTRDYFWGAYVSVLVGETSVVFENPEDDEGFAAIKETKKGKKPHKKGSTR